MTEYERLLQLFGRTNSDYRLIDHIPEGQTERASVLRGHSLESAAKCLVLEVRDRVGAARYVLAVVPGDRRVDLKRIRDLFDGADARMAGRDVAERLTGCRSGCIMPFAFAAELSLVVDPDLLRHERIFFNAGRLDRSVALATRSYLALAGPRVASIVKEVARTAA